LAIRRLVQKKQVDIVHANEPHALSSAWLARAHRLIPVIVARRIALQLSTNIFSRARYHAATRIVAVSHFVAKSVVASGFAADCVDVIYDGVEIPAVILKADRDRARKRFSSQESLCIGNVAGIRQRKRARRFRHGISKLLPQFPKCVLLLPEKVRKNKIQNTQRQLDSEAAVKFQVLCRTSTACTPRPTSLFFLLTKSR
jgi:hypothetical protein